MNLNVNKIERERNQHWLIYIMDDFKKCEYTFLYVR